MAHLSASFPDHSVIDKSKEMTKRPRIAVVGSINMDLVVRCSRLARPGETTIGRSVSEVATLIGCDVASIADAERAAMELNRRGVSCRCAASDAVSRRRHRIAKPLTRFHREEVIAAHSVSIQTAASLVIEIDGTLAPSELILAITSAADGSPQARQRPSV